MKAPDPKTLVSQNFVQYLDTEPSTNDLFDSQAHERTSSAIISLLKDKNNTAKTIALTGTWGSGKSTVIELLKDKIKDLNDYEVFIFNAWSHDKDPIRIVFLDELIKFLIALGWLKDKDKWEEAIEELSGRLKKTKQLQPFGYFVIACGFIIALGTKLASLDLITPQKLDYTFTFPPDLYAVIVFWTPIFLVFFPMFLLYFFHPNQSFYSDQSSNKWIKQYETKNATSIDFKKVFKNILDGILDAGFNRRLLIVIDNLDRLEPETIKEYWSVINTFFEVNGKTKKNLELNYRDVFWLIVPYDPEGLCKKFHSSDNSTEKESNKLFKSFTEKTFQITFKIPPPISNDWEKYMMSLLAKTFPKESQDTHHKIYNIFRYTNKSIFLTPREIILFANKTAAIFQQSPKEIPLEYCAAYVLFEDKIASSIACFQSNNPEECDKMKAEIDEKISIFFLKDQDWQSKLFAIHFNTSPEKAFSIVMMGLIQKHLEAGEYESLIQFRKNPGFIVTVSLIIDQLSYNWIQNGGLGIGLTAYALQNLELPIDYQTIPLFKQLYYIALNTKRIISVNLNSTKGLIYLLKNIEIDKKEPIIALKLLEQFISIKVVVQNEQSEIHLVGNNINKLLVNTWLDSVYVYLDYLKEYHPLLIDQRFNIDLEPQNYISVIKLALSNSSTYREEHIYSIKPKEKPENKNIIDELINQQVDKTFPKLVKVVTIILKNSTFSLKQKELNPLFDVIEPRVFNNIKDLERSYIFETLLTLASINENFKKKLIDLTKSSKFFAAYAMYQQSIDVKTIMVLIIMSYNDTIEWKNRGNDKGLIEHASIGHKSIVEFMTIGDFSFIASNLLTLIYNHDLLHIFHKLKYKTVLQLIQVASKKHPEIYLQLLRDYIIPHSETLMLLPGDIASNFGEHIINLDIFSDRSVLNRFLAYVVPQVDRQDRDVLEWLSRLKSIYSDLNGNSQILHLVGNL